MHGAIRKLFHGAAAAALLAALSPCLLALAQAQPTQAQQNAIRQACRADYQANCASVSPGGAAALSCLQQHSAQLSAACQSAVAAVGGAGSNAPSGGAPSGAGAGGAPAAGTAAASMSPRQQLAVLRGYCGADYRRYCHGVRPGGGRAIQCLQDHDASLSAGCRRALGQFAP